MVLIKTLIGLVVLIPVLLAVIWLAIWWTAHRKF